MLIKIMSIKQSFEDNNINNWELDSEYVDVIFKAILASDLYKEYMQTKLLPLKKTEILL